MKTKDALTAIKEILPAELHLLADPLADLVIWAYDKAWTEGYTAGRIDSKVIRGEQDEIQN